MTNAKNQTRGYFVTGSGAASLTELGRVDAWGRQVRPFFTREEAWAAVKELRERADVTAIRVYAPGDSCDPVYAEYMLNGKRYIENKKAA